MKHGENIKYLTYVIGFPEGKEKEKGGRNPI